jgi:type VI secretion system protein VasD
MKYKTGVVLNINGISKILVIVMSSLVFASCSNVASVLNLDADLELSIVAKGDINPDDTDTASPLVIRLYELKDKKKFEEIEFYDLYANDKKILGKNLIDRHRLKHFVPDSKRKKMFVLDKNTKYIGLFAEFSQYKDSVFRAVIEIDPHFDRKVDVVLTGTVLQVNFKKNDFLMDLDSTDGSGDFDKMKSATESIPGA